jgi:3-polyprenyl-4-hydroxybenzoate decarboxylase
LDHSAIRDSYGGKVGIDATRKPDRTPYTAPAVPAGLLDNLLENRWHSPRDGVIVIGVDKTKEKVRAIFEAVWQIAPDAHLIALDASTNLRNRSEVAWRALGNVDWRRDLVLPGGPVDHFAQDGPRSPFGIDATAKGPADGHPRGWPQENVMSAEIKALVDEKWSSYGVG